MRSWCCCARSGTSPCTSARCSSRGSRTLASAGAYWESQPVEDLLAYLRVLANPLDELALYASLAGPLGGLSRDALALLALGAQERGLGAFELAAGAAAELGLARPDELALERFCAFVERERAGAPLRAIGELIARALEQLERGGGGPRRAGAAPGELANAHKLARLARRFEDSEGRDLRGFLDHVAYLKEQGRAGEADAPALSDSDAVRLMSIHAAKGLEFPVVCVADLGRAPNTRMPDLLVEGERIGLQLAHLDGAKSTPALEYEALCEERRADESREEDRILYVAMTRARERLLLSGALELPRALPARAPTPAPSRGWRRRCSATSTSCSSWPPAPAWRASCARPPRAGRRCCACWRRRSPQPSCSPAPRPAQADTGRAAPGAGG